MICVTGSQNPLAPDSQSDSNTGVVIGELEGVGLGLTGRENVSHHIVQSRA